MDNFLEQHNKFLIKIGQIKEQPKTAAKQAAEKDEE